MNDVTRLLDAIDRGDRRAAGELLPLVYRELRKLAKRMMRNERPGQTLEATALVHEAYLRLIGPHDDPGWQSRGHFYAAAERIVSLYEAWGKPEKAAEWREKLKEAAAAKPDSNPKPAAKAESKNIGQ